MSGNDGDLLSRFREGDREAIVAVARLARMVVGHRGYYIPRTEREDLVQESTVQVYRAVTRPEFWPSVAFEAFVRSVTQRRCIDWVRQRRSTEPVNQELPSSNPDPELHAISSEMRSLAMQALTSLGYSCRRLIRLRVGEGLSYREIAARLKRTEQGVRAQMYKCLKQAKGWLESAG